MSIGKTQRQAADEAERIWRRALAEQDQRRFEEAEHLYDRAVQLAPDDPDVHHNRGGFFKLLGRLEEAEASLREALRLRPAAPKIRHALGIVLLSQGRYAEGWPYYDARHEIPELGLPKPAVSYPEWRGEDLSGKKLLIWGEQGLGDQVMFARFAPLLQAQGAVVTLFCHPALSRLFDGLGVRIVPMSGQVDFPEPDYMVMSGSVAGRAGVSPSTLPRAPYLRGTVAPRGGIGVVSRGNPKHANDRNRSLPDAAAARLMTLPGAVNLLPEHTGAKDLQDTADIIAGLDLVITVDTSAAHVAGAMGKPVWILLPTLMNDWRWMEGRDDSDWYPSARLYRQVEPGDWDSVLDRVERDLSTAPS